MKATGHAGIDEPFAGLFTQGMVVHETYAKANGEWVTPAEVKIEGAEGGARTATLAATGEPIAIGGIEKMSKSKKNTIDPDDIMATYGADVARWFMLSDSPPERDVEWTERGVQGVVALHQPAVAAGRRGRRTGEERPGRLGPPHSAMPALAVRKAAHGALAKVTEAIDKLHFNVAVAHIYEFANALGSAIAKPAPSPDFAWAMREAAGIMVRLFHPMMPHLAEECWAALGHSTLVADEPWPAVEPELLVENTITLPVQVNGKKRADVTVPRDATARRDRGCRPGAGCGTKGARRQAPEKGHRRPAEDRECGGLNVASTLARFAGLVGLCSLLAGCFEPLYGEKTLAGGPGLRQRLSSVVVDPIKAPSGSLQARIAVEVQNDLQLRPHRRRRPVEQDPPAQGRAAHPEPAGHRRHHHRARRRAAVRHQRQLHAGRDRHRQSR